MLLALPMTGCMKDDPNDYKGCVVLSANPGGDDLPGARYVLKEKNGRIVDVSFHVDYDYTWKKGDTIK